MLMIGHGNSFSGEWVPGLPLAVDGGISGNGFNPTLADYGYGQFQSLDVSNGFAFRPGAVVTNAPAYVTNAVGTNYFANWTNYHGLTVDTNITPNGTNIAGLTGITNISASGTDTFVYATGARSLTGAITASNATLSGQLTLSNGATLNCLPTANVSNSICYQSIPTATNWNATFASGPVFCPASSAVTTVLTNQWLYAPSAGSNEIVVLTFTGSLVTANNTIAATTGSPLVEVITNYGGTTGGYTWNAGTGVNPEGSSSVWAVQFTNLYAALRFTAVGSIQNQ
jgi:hypothetical protein